MRASTKELLVSALILSLSGAVYAQGAGAGGAVPVPEATAVMLEATALDKMEAGWKRQMQVVSPAHRPARRFEHDR